MGFCIFLKLHARTVDFSIVTGQCSLAKSFYLKKEKNVPGGGLLFKDFQMWDRANKTYRYCMLIKYLSVNKGVYLPIDLFVLIKTRF